MQNEPVPANPLMKTHIMFRRALTALAFAAVLALTIGSAQGQTNGAPQPKSQSTAPVQAQYDLVIENGVMRTDLGVEIERPTSQGAKGVFG